MNKTHMKLIATMFSLLIAVVMIVTVSYAWMTMSSSPAVSGIQVAVAGGNTILLAPDVTKTVTDADGNEVIVHYPGEFGEKLNFSNYDTYDYLNQVAGLSPVSTADGLSWIAPVYDTQTGLIKDISEFEIDSVLANANVKEEKNGNYIYMDFWIVSPGAEYDIHVATDYKTKEGSFLVELPDVVEDENSEIGFSLKETEGIIASTARVGFLVNQSQQSKATEAMSAYVNSGSYDDRYSHILGFYQEPGEALNLSETYKFTIYEPNSTLHPSMEEYEGAYIETTPLTCSDFFSKTIAETEIMDRVTAQTTTTWRDFVQLEQVLELAVAGMTNTSVESAKEVFYNQYMKERAAALVSTGDFFTSSETLYACIGGDGVAKPLVVANNLKTAGATDDITITTLERNTPQRIRMYIWLEGQDADCTNASSISATEFALSIELSGETK